MNPGVRLQGVTRVVDGETHLSDVNLVLEPGSFNVLLGRTRAGKTSLLRVLAGLDLPDRGTVHAAERDITRLPVRERHVAMVYQQFVNYPSLSVFENIASPLRVAGRVSREQLRERVEEAAALLGLTPYLSRLPAELSGGQQQRTAIARALVKDASLVLLDEPLANLDYKLREDLRGRLRTLFEARGSTVVYATAEPDEALLLGGTRARDQVVVLDEGRVLARGPALQLYAAPPTQRVAQIFSDPELNLLALEVAADGSAQIPQVDADGDAPRESGLALSPVGRERSLLDSGISPTPLDPVTSLARRVGLAKGRYHIGVRADALRLEQRSSSDLRIGATTLVDEVTGSATLIHVAHGGGTLTARVPGIDRRPLGAPITLFISPSQLFVFGLDGRVVHTGSAGGFHSSTED
ncbi:MAG: ABC transporter ATP-binding protein [Polyangiales bacterium]